MRNFAPLFFFFFCALSSYTASFDLSYALSEKPNNSSALSTIAALGEAIRQNNLSRVNELLLGSEFSAAFVGSLTIHTQMSDELLQAISKKYPFAISKYSEDGAGYSNYSWDQLRRFIKNGFVLDYLRTDQQSRFSLSSMPVLHYLIHYREKKSNGCILDDEGDEKLDLKDPEYECIEKLLKAGVNPYYKYNYLLRTHK